MISLFFYILTFTQLKDVSFSRFLLRGFGDWESHNKSQPGGGSDSESDQRCLHLVKVWLFDRDRGRDGGLNHNPIVIFDMKINTDLRNNHSQSVHKSQNIIVIIG